MKPPLVFLNVFALFALTASAACWFSTLVAIHHRRIKSAIRLPFLLGVALAVRDAFRGGSSPLGLIGTFLVVFLACSIAIAYVYGWVYGSRFEEDETTEGSGGFRPVMLVWTGCLAFVGAVLLVNLAVTGTVSPLRAAGF